MKTLLRFLLVVTVLALTTRPAHAVFVLSLTEVGGDVLVDGDGTLDTTDLSFVTGNGFAAQLSPSTGVLISGPSTSGAIRIDDGGGFTGPASFGGGHVAFASTGTGGFVGLGGRGTELVVPSNYVSGTPLTSSSTYTGQTFATLGFTPGTYTYTWGAGVDADSLTVTSVVPEPATWALLGVVEGLLGLTLRRRAARV